MRKGLIQPERFRCPMRHLGCPTFARHSWFAALWLAVAAAEVLGMEPAVLGVVVALAV